MSEAAPSVFIVDDDQAFAESVAWLLSSVGVECKLFDSAQSFLDDHLSGLSGCVIADVRMPSMSGLELQDAMTERDITLPLVIMTAHGDVDTAVLAMKRGAYDFIQKPFNDQAFIDLVQRALADSVAQSERRAQTLAYRELLASLTAREREILGYIVDGKTNRAIAEAAGISEKTVETHRSNVMTKTGAGSVAELVKLYLIAREPRENP